MTDFYIVHNTVFQGCGYMFVRYISDHYIKPNSEVSSAKIPNPYHFRAGDDGTLLVGLLLESKHKEELIQLIGKGRLLEIAVRYYASQTNKEEIEECTERLIWLTSDEEGRRICQHFRDRYKGLGIVFILATLINTPFDTAMLGESRNICTSSTYKIPRTVLDKLNDACVIT